jgi:membrane protein implicated in regulation of membrane protease activity
MTEWVNWWHSLTTLNQWFYSGAAFFSILFGWQLVGGFMGLSEGDGGDADASALAGGHDGFGHDSIAHGDDTHAAVGHADAAHAAAADHGTLVDFKLITVRSILAFFTLFFWAGALYISSRIEPFWSISYAVLWGLAAMAAVATAFYVLQRLAETGTPNIATCVGTRGVVYLDIPQGGQGQARVLVSGAISCVKAQATAGQPIKAGTPVRVLRAVSSTTIEVEPVAEIPNKQGVL